MHDTLRSYRYTACLLFKVLGTLLLVGALQGCGYQQMKKEQFAVDGAWSKVMISYKERDESVAWLTPLLEASSAEDVKLSAWYTEVRSKVQAMNAMGMVTQEPAVFMAMRVQLGELTKATASMMDAGSKLIGAGGPGVAKESRERWIDTLTKMPKQNDQIEQARREYGLAAGTYNDIISVFPNKYTAKVVGIKMLPTFETGIDSTGQPILQTLTESVGAQKR